MSTTIPEQAMDHASVAPASPDDKPATDPRQEAGQDKSIAERLEADPEDADARLDAGLDESMDASDPPAATQPVHNNEPVASSGYNAEEERLRSNA
ncbi:Ribonuclease [Sphingomonas antarctica]|uniref:hypothetical protein n=1 Tax=Sphingomonas antarctica TaxID=2040274 RepID=UPI0039E75C2C